MKDFFIGLAKCVSQRCFDASNHETLREISCTLRGFSKHFHVSGLQS